MRVVVRVRGTTLCMELACRACRVGLFRDDSGWPTHFTVKKKKKLRTRRHGRSTCQVPVTTERAANANAQARTATGIRRRRSRAPPAHAASLSVLARGRPARRKQADAVHKKQAGPPSRGAPRAPLRRRMGCIARLGRGTPACCSTGCATAATAAAGGGSSRARRAHAQRDVLQARLQPRRAARSGRRLHIHTAHCHTCVPVSKSPRDASSSHPICSK